MIQSTTTMTAASASGPAEIKIIYNDCYGGFHFSDAFMAEYKKRTGWDLFAEKRLLQTDETSVRRDPVAIALLEEKGPEWSSGPASFLAIRTIPALFAEYWNIDESEGNETVFVNVAEAYADLLHAYMRDGDQGALVDGYRHVRAAAERLTSVTSWEEGLTASVASVEGGAGLSIPKAVDVGSSSSTGYGFFDDGEGEADTLPHD